MCLKMPYLKYDNRRNWFIYIFIIILKLKLNSCNWKKKNKSIINVPYVIIKNKII